MEDKRLLKILKRMENKLNLLDQKISMLSKEDVTGLKEIHLRIMDMLDSWLSSDELSKIIGYRQEYVSRKLNELKKKGLILEKRTGKKIKYKRVD